MLDLKALLLKLVRYVGSDYIVNYSNYTSATDIDSCITSSVTGIASYASSTTPLGNTSYVRPRRVGRYSGSDGVEWAWKITYIPATGSFFPLRHLEGDTYTNPAVTSSGGWDFVEIYAKFPTQVITRNVATNREYRFGYSASTPSGTASDAFGATETLKTYTWPFPSSFFNNYYPCSICGCHSVASPAVSRVWGNTTSTGYNTYAYTSISTTGTAATTYNVPLFSYMFFTRPHQD